jgi:hypothetical protein
MSAMPKKENKAIVKKIFKHSVGSIERGHWCKIQVQSQLLQKMRQ